MQRRLTIALVGVALASVLLIGAGVIILAQIGAREQAEEEAIDRLDILAESVAELNESQGFRRGPVFERLVIGLGLNEAELIVVDPEGVVRIVNVEPGLRGGAAPDPQPIAILDEAEQELLLAGEPVLLDRGGREVTVLRSFGGIGGPTSTGSQGTEPVFALLVERSVVTVGSEARLWFVVSAVAVLSGAIVASWLLARRFTTPIRQIEEATAAVAAGDFSARVETHGDDELAQLGRSVNDMAADLERSKALDQQFLMSVSHDLRTPLTAITGYAEALGDGAATDPAHTGAIIAANAARLERLVGDLLDLAKLDANRFRFQVRRFDVDVAVGRVVAGLAPRAEHHGIDLRFEGQFEGRGADGRANATAMIEADPDRVAQAVGNLIDNAITFAHSAVVARVVAGPEAVAIIVDDDGPGIAEVDLPHVFERLYVSRSQPARAENPSGMGLAIVRELATAMSGSIAAGRASIGGTSMTLTLPRTAAVTSRQG